MNIGATAFALVKASSNLAAKEIGTGRVSARNQLTGKVAHVTPGAVIAEVVIDLASGDDAMTIAAVVTPERVKSLGLLAGTEAAEIFKASSVIVGVPA